MLPHPLVHVTSFEQLGPFTLHIRFDDGAEQTIDFEQVLFGQMFEPLRDPEYFSQVRIDPEFQTLVWPNDADFDPATLRYWPEYLPYLINRSEQEQAQPKKLAS